MEASDKAKCEEWVKAHRTSWQVLNRSQWKYQFRGKAMVRFVEEAGMRENEVRLLLEYLTSDDCIATLSLYDQTVSSEWKPIRAYYEISNKSHGNIHAVRLYHAMQTDPSETDGGTYLVENGCAYKVSIRYVWNAASVETVPQGTSGVSYRIEGISQDPETGRYSYAVEKRERVQQDIDEYLAESTVFADVKIEQHTGVKGANTQGGKQASVGNGKRVRRRVTKNADCTHDVHNETIEEKRVDDAVVEYRKGLYGTVKTTTHKGQAQPLNGNGMVIGESRSTRKTEGGLNDNTVSKPTGEPAGKIAKGASDTVFESEEHETENVAAGGELPEEEVASAGDGETHAVEVRMQENGSADVTKRKRKEKAVSEAVVELHKTLRGKRRTVTHRGQQSPLDENGMEVGETRRSQKTGGGRYDNTISKTTPEAVGETGHDEENSIYHKRKVTHKNVAADPGEDERVAGDGKTYSRHSRKNDLNTWDVDESEGEEKPVTNAVVRKTRTRKGVVTQWTDRNVNDTSPEPQEIGDSVVIEKTPGGKVNITKTTGGHEPIGKSGESCSRDAFAHRRSETKNEQTLQSVETAFEEGKIIRKSGVDLGDGTANNTVETTTAVPGKNEYHYTREDGAVVHVVKYWNQQVIPNHPEKAAGLTVADSINAFSRHSGSIKWLTGVPERWNAVDFKFNKHGARSIDLAIVKFDKRTRKKSHKVWKVRLSHIRGDAYSDFVSDELNADIARTSAGVLAVKLIEKYADSSGNLLAEWKRVSLDTPPANWEACTNQCKHITEGMSLGDAVKILLEGGDVRMSNNTDVRDLSRALDTQLALSSIGGRHLEW